MEGEAKMPRKLFNAGENCLSFFFAAPDPLDGKGEKQEEEKKLSFFFATQGCPFKSTREEQDSKRAICAATKLVGFI